MLLNDTADSPCRHGHGLEVKVINAITRIGTISLFRSGSEAFDGSCHSEGGTCWCRSDSRSVNVADCNSPDRPEMLAGVQLVLVGCKF